MATKIVLCVQLSAAGGSGRVEIIPLAGLVYPLYSAEVLEVRGDRLLGTPHRVAESQTQNNGVGVWSSSLLQVAHPPPPPALISSVLA